MLGTLMNRLLHFLLTKNFLPDLLLRYGIRRRLAAHLQRFKRLSLQERQELFMKHLHSLKQSPLAVATQQANEQHYELPTDFFEHVLGKQKKYSSGFWKDDTSSLDQAEEEMLRLTAERAELQEGGQRILELGCGWGSLTLWMATHYPDAQITAISNSKTQREYINAQLAERHLTNVTVRTVNMIDYLGEGEALFDRVVSVEMFEHMKNYQLLLQRIATWLKPGGMLFVHLFSHREIAYHYEIEEGEDDWMARYFFTGGQMPSDDLLLYFQEDLRIKDHWHVCGTHYQKTARAWLENMDRAKKRIIPLLATTYGEEQKKRWWVYWRLFFMACEELWGYRQGEEWMVSHYLFEKKT